MNTTEINQKLQEMLTVFNSQIKEHFQSHNLTVQINTADFLVVASAGNDHENIAPLHAHCHKNSQGQWVCH
ncbi:hypothetical protein [Ferruginibacter sp.]